MGDWGLTPRSSKAGLVMALDEDRYGGPGSHMWDNYVELMVICVLVMVDAV